MAGGAGERNTTRGRRRGLISKEAYERRNTALEKRERIFFRLTHLSLKYIDFPVFDFDMVPKFLQFLS
jgi:hypothetical protein